MAKMILKYISGKNEFNLVKICCVKKGFSFHFSHEKILQKIQSSLTERFNLSRNEILDWNLKNTSKKSHDKSVKIYG